MTPIEVLAEDIDEFAFDYDPYEYHDTVDDREDALKELTITLRSGEAGGTRNWLQNIVDEDDPGEMTEKAAQLLDRLNQLVPETKAERISHSIQNAPPGAEQHEALLILDDAAYLHVQPPWCRMGLHALRCGDHGDDEQRPAG